jgi:hypothetical protein
VDVREDSLIITRQAALDWIRPLDGYLPNSFLSIKGISCLQAKNNKNKNKIESVATLNVVMISHRSNSHCSAVVERK